MIMVHVATKLLVEFLILRVDFGGRQRVAGGEVGWVLVVLGGEVVGEEFTALVEGRLVRVRLLVEGGLRVDDPAFRVHGRVVLAGLQQFEQAFLVHVFELREHVQQLAQVLVFGLGWVRLDVFVILPVEVVQGLTK